MRNFISIIMVILLLSLTSCNEKPKAELQVVIERDIQNEEVYTPEFHKWQCRWVPLSSLQSPVKPFIYAGF